MKRQTKAIVEYGLPTFVKEILEAVEQGWEVDSDNPPCTWGTTYEAHLTRSADITDEQKASRAEILAKARAAKAAKAAAEKEEEDQE